MMKAAVLYWSKTGNTRKVASAVREGLEASGLQVIFRKTDEAKDLEWLDYDLICVGFPSYQWHPPEAVVNYLVGRMNGYRQQGRVKVGSPGVPGRNALVFCTYSGPHTGINEAIPAGKYVGQFFEHLGFKVLDEWYVVGEFHGKEEESTKGRLGDTRGRPNAEDLKKIKEDAAKIARSLLT